MQRLATDPQRAQLALATGAVALARAEYSAALEWLETARKAFQSLMDQRGEADSLRMLGELAVATGDTDLALSQYRAAYRAYQTVGDVSLADECRDKAGLAQTLEKPTYLDDGERNFKDNLTLIQQVIDFISRRNRATPDERDDFASEVFLRLIENDYAILRKFSGRHSLRTYLLVVIRHAFEDYRTRAWGKWRPSAEARQYGEVGVLLERLTSRDGLSWSEAVSLVRVHASSAKHSVSEAELAAIGEKLPQRFRRQFVGEETLFALPAEVPSDFSLEGKEQAARAQEVRSSLMAELERLDADDSMLIRMRYFDNQTIAAMSRILRTDQKTLYKRLEKLRHRLQRDLQLRGVSADDALEFIDSGVS